MVLAGVFRILGQKCLKLGGFTCVFAEITDVMSLKPDSRRSGTRFQNTIYTRTEKNQTVFLLFLVFSALSERIRTQCVPALLGAATPPWWPRSRSATGSIYRETRAAYAFWAPRNTKPYCNYFQFSFNIKNGLCNQEDASLGAAMPPRWPRSRSATGSIYRETRAEEELELWISLSLPRDAHGKNFSGNAVHSRFAGGGFAASVSSLRSTLPLYFTARRADQVVHIEGKISLYYR